MRATTQRRLLTRGCALYEHLAYAACIASARNAFLLIERICRPTGRDNVSDRDILFGDEAFEGVADRFVAPASFKEWLDENGALVAPDSNGRDKSARATECDDLLVFLVGAPWCSRAPEVGRGRRIRAVLRRSLISELEYWGPRRCLLVA